MDEHQFNTFHHKVTKKPGARILITNGFVFVVVLIFIFSPQPTHLAVQAQPAIITATINLPALTDARITQGKPATACGKEPYLAAGYDRLGNPSQGVVRSLLKFDLTRLPQGAVVSQAVLHLYYFEFSGPLSGTSTLGVAPVLGPWAENSVQWSTAPAIAPGAPITATVNHEQVPNEISFVISEMVQGWLEGSLPDYGLELFGMDETASELSSVEFFESNNILIPPYPGTPLNPPHVEVTYQLPARPVSRIDLLLSPTVFMPLILNNFPPELDLHPIDNDGGEGNYTITWSTHPKGTNQYELFEWVGGQWQVIFTTTSGETSFLVKDKPLGTYLYYLKATGDGWTETSLVRNVRVKDKTNEMVYLVVGVGNYQNMPAVYAPDARLGNDLEYPVFDATDIQDMLEVYGFVEGQPSEHVLALKDRQATKSAIRSAITSWLDAREAANTTIFIYFAGHTLLQDSKPYLAPYDLACDPCSNPPTDSTWLASSGISAQEINAWLGELASSQVLFVIDSAESERWINELSGPGRQVLAGSMIGERRWEFDDIKNGAFSWFLNEAYVQGADQNGSGGISISEAYDFSVPMYKYVYSQTLGAYQQHPVLSPGSSSQKDFINTVSPYACQSLP